MTKSRGLINKRHNWTDAQLVLLGDKWPNTTAATIATLIGVSASQVYSQAKRMELKKSAEFLASPASGRMTKGSTLGMATRIKPGNVPWTKGMKGVRLGIATEFKPGSVPVNRQEVGALRINSMGDIDIKVSEGKNQWLSLRRYVWEQVHGPIPEGMCIVPMDYDPHNTQIENLKMVDRAGNVHHNLLGKYPKELRNVMALGGRLRNQITKLKEAEHV